MSSLINISGLSSLIQIEKEKLIKEVTALNGVSGEYGLTLNKAQAEELIETRGRSLRENLRIEFGNGLGAVKKIIESFCSSTYLNKENYAETLNDLVEIFYYYKTESHDRVSDGELIKIMLDQFENKYHGSVELMRGREFRYMKDYDDAPSELGDDGGDDPDVKTNDDYIWDGEDDTDT